MITRIISLNEDIRKREFKFSVATCVNEHLRAVDVDSEFDLCLCTCNVNFNYAMRTMLLVNLQKSVFT